MYKRRWKDKNGVGKECRNRVELHADEVKYGIREICVRYNYDYLKGLVPKVELGEKDHNMKKRVSDVKLHAFSLSNFNDKTITNNFTQIRIDSPNSTKRESTPTSTWSQ